MHAPSSHDGHEVEQTLVDLNRRWMQAYVRQDLAFLREYVGEGYVGTFPDGSVHSKQGEIEAIGSGRVAIDEMVPEEMRVQLYGDTAVLTGRSRVRAHVAGTPLQGSLRFTDVWVCTAKGWRAAASHVTQVAS